MGLRPSPAAMRRKCRPRFVRSPPLAPAKMHGALTIERAGKSDSVAKLALGGTLGAMRLTLNGDATGSPAQADNAMLRVNGRLDADDGGALVRLLALDHVLAVDQLPGQLTAAANGPSTVRSGSTRWRLPAALSGRWGDASARRGRADRESATSGKRCRFAAAAARDDRSGWRHSIVAGLAQCDRGHCRTGSLGYGSDGEVRQVLAARPARI